MKRNNQSTIIAIILILAIMFSLMTIYAFGEGKENDICVSARSATLFIPENGEFIYSKNSEQRLPMASTTKIMTALIALEMCDMNETIEIGESASGIEGSSAYLKVGDTLTMEELIYALLLQSANDAAVAIAEYIGGNIAGFADIMNERASQMGLNNTNFTNPHGLDDDEHYTTARDLAIIAGVALSNDDFVKIVSTKKRTFSTEDRVRTYVNHNKLLSSYEGCIGVKTGYTKRCGRCLVSAAVRDDLLLVSVTLDAPNDWSDHKKMLDFGFDSYEKITFADKMAEVYKIGVLGSDESEMIVLNTESASAIVKKGSYITESHPKLMRFATAPIKRGDIMGEIIYTIEGKEAARVDLVATKDINVKKEKGLFSKILSFFK